MFIYHIKMQIDRKLSGSIHTIHLAMAAHGGGSSRGKGAFNVYALYFCLSCIISNNKYTHDTGEKSIVSSI